MSKRLVPLFSLMALVCLAFSAVPFSRVTQAQGLEGGAPDRSLLRSERPQARGDLRSLSARIDARLQDATGTIKVMIELRDVPAARTYDLQRRIGSEAQAQDMARAQVVRIEQAQSQLISRLNAYNARVTNRAQRVFNAVTVLVDASRLQAIARLPNVKAIHKVGIYYTDHQISVPLIGAPQVWTGNGTGFTGKGMQIGIIDTGIDYLHTNFGGTGSPISYTTTITHTDADHPGFPNAKVVGGTDLVGDDYNASSNNPEQTIPVPDPDPMDCNGHGSHVAGTAAGFGVKGDGTTFTGPYNSTTPFADLRIGPGVAPEADLFAIRVFGCAGSVDEAVLVDSIEYAVDPNEDGDLSDHLDVINLSIGSAYNSAEGPSQLASDTASLAGVIVTGSGGNEGDTYYITGGSAGNARRAIAAASSVDSTDVLDGFRINTPPPVRVRPGNNSANYTYTGPVTGDLVYPPTQRGGCQPFSAENAALLNGKIALVDWNLINGQNECGSTVKANNATAAGAIGVIMVYPKPVLDITIAGNDKIPSILVPSAVGQELKTDLAAGTVNVTLTDEYNVSVKLTDNNRTDTLSDFSSRGPRRTDSLLKPDIAAPGQTILSAATGTGNKAASFNGTSMAAPHVAGGVALMRQMHPNWSVEEIKALVMNTANSDIRSGNAANSALYGPGRVGAGRITLQQAQNSQVVMYDADGAGAVSVSFGNVEVVGTASATKRVRVVNKGSSAAAYTVGYTSRVDVPGVAFSFSPSAVTLAGGTVVTITVTMTADASNMQHTSDPTIADSQSGADRAWLSEEAGLLTLTPETNAIPSLRLPVHALARPASAMQASSSTLVIGTGATADFEIGLTGQRVFTGPARLPEFPLDEISAVSAFELQHTSPVTTSAPGVLQHADLKNVGVASDYHPSGTITDTLITFGIATHGNWSTPNEVFFAIDIDTNGDGELDYTLYNYNLGEFVGGDFSDEFVTSLDIFDEEGDYVTTILQAYLNGVSPAQFNTVPFNTSVMALPVYASDLGLTPGDTQFNYSVTTYSRTEGPGGVIDTTPWLSYDVALPGLDLSGGEEGPPLYFDLDGESIPVTFNRAGYTANASKGVLLLHHHNATGNHDEVVNLADMYQRFLPAIQR